MLLPTIFKSIEEDYHHLKREVQIWDVACERQVEICGPDAKKLVQSKNINYIANKCIKQEYQKLFLKANPVFPVLQ